MARQPNGMCQELALVYEHLISADEKARQWDDDYLGRKGYDTLRKVAKASVGLARKVSRYGGRVGCPPMGEP